MVLFDKPCSPYLPGITREVWAEVWNDVFGPTVDIIPFVRDSVDAHLWEWLTKEYEDDIKLFRINGLESG